MSERRRVVRLIDHYGHRFISVTDEQLTRIETRMWNPGAIKLVYENDEQEMFTRLIRLATGTENHPHNAFRVKHVIISSRE